MCSLYSETPVPWKCVPCDSKYLLAPLSECSVCNSTQVATLLCRCGENNSVEKFECKICKQNYKCYYKWQISTFLTRDLTATDPLTFEIAAKWCSKCYQVQTTSTNCDCRGSSKYLLYYWKHTKVALPIIEYQTVSWNCICKLTHTEKAAICVFESNNTIQYCAFFSYEPIPWTCRNCKVTRRFNVDRCPTCLSHPLRVSWCKCGLCEVVSDGKCSTCKQSPEIVYVWNLDQLDVYEAWIRKLKPNDGIVASFCASCLTIRKQKKKSSKCGVCSAIPRGYIYYRSFTKPKKTQCIVNKKEDLKYVSWQCTCFANHEEKAEIHSQGKELALFSYDPIPWFCRSCGGKWGRCFANCSACKTHPLTVELCACGRCLGHANFCTKCLEIPKIAYVWNLDLLEESLEWLVQCEPSSFTPVASLCPACNAIQRYTTFYEECRQCKIVTSKVFIYLRFSVLAPGFAAPYLFEPKRPHPTTEVKMAQQIAKETKRLRETLNDGTQEEDMDLALALSLSMSSSDPEMKTRASTFSYTEKKKDWSYAFFKETVLNEEKPWWCKWCDKLNPKTLVPRSGGGWGTVRFYCVHCEQERQGVWNCETCDFTNSLDLYDVDKYNCSTPGQENPPPPHQCKNGKCRKTTRTITIYYEDNVDLDEWKAKYLFHTKKTKSSIMKEEKYIDVETFRRKQQMDILSYTCGNLRLAQSLINPEKLDLHPQEVFQVLQKMIRTEVADDVIFWLFLSKKLCPGQASDHGTWQSLWPKWMECCDKNKEACEFLIWSLLFLAHLLPFELWWLICAYFTRDNLKGFNKWKRWKKTTALAATNT